MNLPNKLTVARAVLTPVFMAVMLVSCIPLRFTAALLIFIVASLTDLFDGRIARSRNLVTSFGKFLDPVADKMLTTAAMLGFMIILPTHSLRVQMTVITFITLFREFIVSSVRVIAMISDNKKVIAANMWGKLKTVFQMISIILGLTAYSFKEFFAGFTAVFDISTIAFIVLSWIAAVFTVVSGVIYVLNNKEVLDFSK